MGEMEKGVQFPSPNQRGVRRNSPVVNQGSGGAAGGPRKSSFTISMENIFVTEIAEAGRRWSSMAKAAAVDRRALKEIKALLHQVQKK